MSDLLEQLDEVVTLVREKHQQGRHSQSSHTPKKYGKGGAVGKPGEGTRALAAAGIKPASAEAAQRVADKLSGAATAEQIVSELEGATGNRMAQAFGGVGRLTAGEFSAGIRSQDAIAREVGAKHGTKIRDNTQLHRELKPGDHVLYISGGGYGVNFGKLSRVSRSAVPAADRPSDGAWRVNFTLEGVAGKPGIQSSTYPKANWHAAADEFYKVNVKP